MDILEAIDRSSRDTEREEIEQIKKDLCQYSTVKRFWMTEPERQEMDRLKSRLAILQTGGAKIDLGMILAEKRDVNIPRWSLANPAYGLSDVNGSVGFDGGGFTHYYKTNRASEVSTVRGSDEIHHGLSPSMSFRIQRYYVPVGGFPILPQRIRSLLNTKAVRRAFASLILYQPTEWTSLVPTPKNPDPALIVRWTQDSPWKCLAVWGHDGPHIEEFLR